MKIIKNLLKMRGIMGVCLAGMYAVSSIWAQEIKDENTRKGYRIEMVVDTVQKEPYVKTTSKIVILSPEGNIIREFQKDWTGQGVGAMVSDKRNFVLNAEILPREYLSEKFRDRYVVRDPYEGMVGVAPYKLEFINRKGETVKERVYEVYFGSAPGLYIEKGISKNGNRIFFKYLAPPYGKETHLIVFDTLGNEVLHISVKKEEAFGSIQISPDGKIIGASTSREMNGKYVRHLFFLDVETGRTKVVKAEGEGWRVDFAFSPYMATPPGKIYIGWGIYKDPQNRKWIKGGYKYLTFDELPEDLSTLFEEGGEK